MSDATCAAHRCAMRLCQFDTCICDLALSGSVRLVLLEAPWKANDAQHSPSLERIQALSLMCAHTDAAKHALSLVGAFCVVPLVYRRVGILARGKIPVTATHSEPCLLCSC